MKQIFLRGVGVYPFTTRDEIIDYVNTNKGILVAINAEKVLHATDETKQIINRNIGYCDGAGVQLALKQKGIKNASKIPGCELWLNIIEKYQSSHSFYLVGGKQDVIEATVTKLKAQYPYINILGYRNGYLKTDAERAELIDDICNLKPDVVFVAMGSPKQELLMEEIQKRHNAVFQGLGGSFDVYTGHVKRAPAWWVNHNLEFAYRLIKEPKRILRQIHLVKFAYWLILHRF